MAIDPHDSSNVYATGYNIGTGSGCFIRSYDKGVSWRIDLGVFPSAGYYLHVAPANPAVLYVSTERGLYKSSDSGATWNRADKGIRGGSVSQVAVAPSEPTTLYVGSTDSNEAPLHVSRDSGETWTALGAYPQDTPASALLVHATNSNWVVALQEIMNFQNAEAFWSEDGGVSWGAEAYGLYSGLCLAGDPAMPDRFYGGGLARVGSEWGGGLARTDNGGASWQQLIELFSSTGLRVYCEAIAVAPSESTRLYAGGYMSLGSFGNSEVWCYRVDHPADLNITKTDVSASLIEAMPDSNNARLTALWVHPNNANRVLAATTQGVYATSDGGETWNATLLKLSTEAFSYHYQYDILYAATSSAGVFYSEDGGVAWQELNNGLPSKLTVDLDIDIDNGYLYAATNGGGLCRLSIGPPSQLEVSPQDGFFSAGPMGGPFTSPTQTFILANKSTSTLSWTTGATPDWLELSLTEGELGPLGSVEVLLSLTDRVYSLDPGRYDVFVSFLNPRMGGEVRVRAILEVRGVASFAWTPVTSPQKAYEPFNVSLSARDSLGALVRAFDGRVYLNRTEAAQITVGTGTKTWTYPMATFYPQARTQVIYLASEIGTIGFTGGVISGIALDVETPPLQAMQNWTIRMQHTDLSAFDSLEWQPGGWTTVYQGDATVTTGGWATFQFSTPFDYNGADHLLVDFSFNNSWYTEAGQCFYFDPGGRERVLYKGTDGGYGSPLSWSGALPAPLASEKIPNIRFFIDKTDYVAPYRTGDFVNGAWSGNVTVYDAGTAVRLRASDGEGRDGKSNAFVVQPGVLKPTAAPEDWKRYR